MATKCHWCYNDWFPTSDEDSSTPDQRGGSFVAKWEAQFPTSDEDSSTPDVFVRMAKGWLYLVSDL